MKKALLLLMILFGINIFCIDFSELETDSFRFYTSGSQNDLIEKIEDFNTTLNKSLKFESTIEKRKIYILENKDSYDQYINELGIEEREDFVYITYNRPENNRLIIYKNKEDLERSLNYHLTLQYINNSQNSVSDWYKEGLSSYFEDYGRYNENKKSDKFWSTFYYLFNTDNLDDKRVLWDSLSYIRWEKEKFDQLYIDNLFNEHSIFAKALVFTDEFISYEDRVEEAINLYNNKKYKAAKTNLEKLIKENSEDHITHYYLGLCLSNLKEYNIAYSNLSKSIDLGSSKDLTYYSIAVNFYNSGNDKGALKYLDQINKESDIYKKSRDLYKTIKK